MDAISAFTQCLSVFNAALKHRVRFLMATNLRLSNTLPANALRSLFFLLAITSVVVLVRPTELVNVVMVVDDELIALVTELVNVVIVVFAVAVTFVCVSPVSQTSLSELQILCNLDKIGDGFKRKSFMALKQASAIELSLSAKSPNPSRHAIMGCN